MAVAFMASLERSPETYEQEFDNVLDGRGHQIMERILEFISPEMKVLDLGCGPGQFVIEASKKGATVIGVDSNESMIAVAKKRASSRDRSPEFVQADALSLCEDSKEVQEKFPSLFSSGTFDVVVSTFLLSELTPTQRNLFLQIVRGFLSDDGILVIAAESLPKSSSDRKIFWKNRELAESNAQVRLQPPIESLEVIVEKAGLIVEECENYGPEITYLVGRRSNNEPSHGYGNRTKPVHGVHARTRIWYNHLTGGWRGIPIKPGLYLSGAPTQESPVVVTANYELTYYTVMRALAKENIDAWVLVCDTNGINVWCAARGVHFDSDDVIQMIQLTGLAKSVNHRELILPQLAAAGMDPSYIRKRTGFSVRYGPVRIQDLSEWLELEKPRPKPRKMATVTFNLRERMEQTVAHVPFLFAVMLGKPIAAILGVITLINVLASMAPPIFAVTYPLSLQILLFISQFIFALIANALVLGLLFPVLPSKGNSFWRRGLGLAAITLPIGFLIMISIGTQWTTQITWIVIQFILAISLTMDWSGMTSISDPKVIRREFPYLVLTLKVGAVILISFNILVAIIGW
ncbi:MAG: methyltransferase domain-containing protein [Candidatus Thorarchaeota archaeon]|jgi:cyclopropane fatty-acyl-phospholipid synthase-like methyltransferase